MTSSIPPCPKRTLPTLRLLGAASLAAAFLLALAGTAGATTTTVNCAPYGSGNLQAAIDAAAPGATIVVNGTCTGNFVTGNKDLTLQGGLLPRTLDGGGTGSAFYIYNDPDVVLITVTVKGLVIKNGDAAVGGGINITDPNINVVVMNSLVAGNHAQEAGGGIQMEDPSENLTVTNSIIRDNTVSGGGVPKGGGIQMDNSTQDVTLIGSKVLDNTASDGGGIDIDEEDTGLTLVNSVVSGNEAVFGGGIRNEAGLAGAGIDISGSTISDNHALIGGGIQLDSPTNMTIASSTISGNTADGFGGGIGYETRDSTMDITDSLIVGNTAGVDSTVGGDGGGIWQSGGNNIDLTLTRTQVRQNTALASSTGDRGNGGGIHFEACATTNTLLLDHTTITDNRAKTNGGGISNRGHVSICNGGIAQVIATDSQITHNLAQGNGGGIYNVAENGSSAIVLLFHSAVGAIPGTLANGNGAARGGGIYNDGSEGGATAVGLDPSSAVLRNLALVDGGGIFNDGGGIFADPGSTVAFNIPNDCVAC